MRRKRVLVLTVDRHMPALGMTLKEFIPPSAETVSFAEALNRSVTGSMSDHIHAAKFKLEDDIAPSEIGYRLNETPMSALVGADGRKYGYPKEVFVNLVDRLHHE